MSRLLDKRNKDGTFPFEYRNSASTSVKETFERLRQQQPATDTKVSQIKPHIRVRKA